MPENVADKKTILVVDNSVINRMQIAGILSSTYDIVEAEDGQSALDAMREYGKDKLACVLLDLYMPGITGFDVLVGKREDPAIADIPVIIITANNVTDSEVEALDLGASDFLSKPFEPEIMHRRIHSVVYAREIEEQRTRIRLLEEIAWRSDHDELTGLLTRSAFIRETHQMLVSNPDTSYVLVAWDFEKFKMLNELFGTEAGDEVLKVAADGLRQCVKDKGVYARLNNDYFAFCVPEGSVDVEQVIDQIITGVHEFLNKSNISLSLVIAAGVYPIEDHETDISVALDRAMIAQYTIKGDYNTHIGYYNAELSNHLLEEQEILNNMESALANGEFKVVLQPVYDVTTGRPASAEALVRWYRPGYGIISPGVFIPLFEQNGFITKMDFNIWEQVCQILANRRAAGLPELPISVNLSRRSIYSPALVETIIELTNKYDIKPELFRIEVTESSYVEDSDRIIDTVKRLQDHGFTILMDDFGSGYSSLTSLSDIPVDILKADMMFMREFESGGRISSIFTSVVRMARWLGIPVIAEGVETEEQVEFLRSVGCRYTQGYFFARPMPPEEFEEHLVEHPVRRIGEEDLKFSEEDIDQIMGGNHLLDQIMDGILDAYVICEWNDGNPEMLRLSESFTKLFSADGVEDVYAPEFIKTAITAESRKKILAAMRDAIDGGQRVKIELDFVDANGDDLPLELIIFCVNSIETDAMFFIGMRKL